MTGSGDDFGDKSYGRHIATWIGIGVAGGVGLGLVFGWAWGNATGVSMAIGIAIGTAISLGLCTLVAIALDSRKPAGSRVPQSKNPDLS